MTKPCSYYVRQFLSCALTGVLAVASGLGAQRAATSPETKARMIQMITTLETDPYNKNAKAYRREVLTWLTDAPDVSVELCANMLGDVKKLKGDDGAALVGQLASSEAKFILEYPDRAKDRHAVQLAGLEGTIRTYQAMKAANPKMSFDPLEHLVQLQRGGQLDGYVDQALAGCK